MIENTAFKNFELWWDEQARGVSDKEKPVDDVLKKDAAVPLQDISNKKDDSLKSIIDSRDFGLDLGGYGLGLGLRASIPKMPSFRRKRKQSPVLMDEDSSNKRLSDQVCVYFFLNIKYNLDNRIIFIFLGGNCTKF